MSWTVVSAVVPRVSVAVMVTVVDESGIFGIPVNVPVEEFNSNPYAVKSIEAENTMGVAAAVDVAENTMGVV